MIPFEFEYYRPASIDEAIKIFADLDSAGQDPMYYGGGTEFISMARMSNLKTGAVIDIKAVPEHRMLEMKGEQLLIGSAVTLTQIHESNLFPLLAQSAARVADHTIQNKITLGGNLCGTIIYRETVLPLLLADSEVVIAAPKGTRTVPLGQVFDQRMRLDRGELVSQLIVPQSALSHPYIHVKRTKQDKINYPLVTICAMGIQGEVRLACSGLCDFPFRSAAMEKELNNTGLSIEQRIDNAVTVLPGPILDNLDGSSQYRRFILSNLLKSIVNELEG